MNLSFLKHKKINQVIWLGVGDLAKADLVFSTKTTVHLVDADEATIERLHKRFKQDKNVTIHPLLISDNNNNIDFSYYSLNEFNGIAQPTALKQRYPGLKQLKTDNKKATAISTLIKNVDLVAQKNNAIILDLPGLSARLLQTLINDKTIHLFNELVVLTSQEPLFKDDLPANDLIDLLEKNGFLCKTHKSSYQDYVIVQAELNPLYEDLTEIKNQLTNAQSEIKNNQTLLIKAQKESEGLLQEKQIVNQQLIEAKKQKDELQNKTVTLIDQKEQLENQLEQIKTEHQAQLMQLSKDSDELHAQQLESMINERNQARIQAKDADIKIAEIEKTQVDKDKQIESLIQERNQVRTQLEALNSKILDVEKNNADQMKVFQEIKESEQKHKDWGSNLKQKLEISDKEVLKLTQQLAELDKQLAEKAELVEEHNKWNQGLKQENNTLKASLEHLKNIETELENTKNLLELKDKQTSSERQSLQEQQFRNERLEKEVVKLEAQLELIKDVILRDKAF